MTRRETPADRDREAAVARRLRQSNGWMLKKAPDAYRVDYFLMADGGGGAVAGALEVKSRRNCWGDHASIVFNLGKLLWCQ
jgi:hypothetical protein